MAEFLCIASAGSFISGYVRTDMLAVLTVMLFSCYYLRQHCTMIACELRGQIFRQLA